MGRHAGSRNLNVCTAEGDAYPFSLSFLLLAFCTHARRESPLFHRFGLYRSVRSKAFAGASLRWTRTAPGF